MVAEALAKDYVLVKIDQDEMAGGKAVAGALRDHEPGGIPWFAHIAPSRGALIGAGEGGYRIDRSAVLSTADGPAGNVGCPMTRPERAHFMGTLRATRRHMTDEDIRAVAEALHAYARETIGGEADGN